MRSGHPLAGRRTLTPYDRPDHLGLLPERNGGSRKMKERGEEEVCCKVFPINDVGLFCPFFFDITFEFHKDKTALFLQWAGPGPAGAKGEA